MYPENTGSGAGLSVGRLTSEELNHQTKGKGSCLCL